MLNKTLLDELIEHKWPWLPINCEIVADEKDACMFQLKNGTMMGINRNEEVFWRNIAK